MHPIPIADLCRDDIQPGYITAIVMVKWPYSSARNEMAVILAEPSLRLRRANGQVKARFTGAGGLALDKAHIAVGDEMLLSLQDAVAEERSGTEKLERGLGFELCYAKGAAMRVLRNGVEVFSLNALADGGMVPLPEQPRPCTPEAPTIAGPQYSSCAINRF
jgi:hypothetical protein